MRKIASIPEPFIYDETKMAFNNYERSAKSYNLTKVISGVLYINTSKQTYFTPEREKNIR